MLSTGFQASFGHENSEQTRHLVSIVQPDVTYISKENIREQKEVLIRDYLQFISLPCTLKHGKNFLYSPLKDYL